MMDEEIKEILGRDTFMEIKEGFEKALKKGSAEIEIGEVLYELQNEEEFTAVMKVSFPLLLRSILVDLGFDPIAIYWRKDGITGYEYVINAFHQPSGRHFAIGVDAFVYENVLMFHSMTFTRDKAWDTKLLVHYIQVS